MPNLITENSSISGYIESLFSKHLENASGLSVVSGNPLLDGFFSNTHRNANSTILDDATGVSARFYLDTYNNTNTRGSSYRGRRFRGSQDYPSGVHFNDNILHFSADGYDGTEVISASAIMTFVAAENWTSGKNGTYFRVGLTPSGQTGRIDRLLIKDEGSVGLSNSNPLYTLDVSGGGNFTQGVYWNGIAVNTGIDISTFSSSANLTQTGQVLDNKINSLSGNNYSSVIVTGSNTISNPNFSGIGTTLIFRSGNFVLVSGAAGGADISNLATKDSVTLTGQTLYSYSASLSGNLAVTGSSLDSKINTTNSNLTLSGQNLYSYSSSISGNLASTGSVLSTLLNSTIVNLGSTGSQLYNYSSSISGNLFSSGSSLSSRIDTVTNNLTTSGVNLYSYSSSISGNLSATGSDLSTLLNSTVTNLFTTGQTLDNKIGALSGNNYSSLKVTGSTAISTPNFSGIGTTQVFRSGDFVLISGAPAGAGAGEANTISSLGGGISVYNTKVGVDLRLNSISGGTGISTTLLGDNTISINSTIKNELYVPFVTNSVTWTNMPAALSFFGGTNTPIQKLNLANYTGVSLRIAKGATAGAAASVLQLRYLGNYNATVANWLNLTSPIVYSFINRTNSFIDSGYYPLVNGSRSGVFVALVGSGNDGVIDPVVGCVTAHFM